VQKLCRKIWELCRKKLPVWIYEEFEQRVVTGDILSISANRGIACRAKIKGAAVAGSGYNFQYAIHPARQRTR
jgi:hypothetical protein